MSWQKFYRQPYYSDLIRQVPLYKFQMACFAMSYTMCSSKQLNIIIIGHWASAVMSAHGHAVIIVIISTTAESSHTTDTDVPAIGDEEWSMDHEDMQIESHGMYI